VVSFAITSLTLKMEMMMNKYKIILALNLIAMMIYGNGCFMGKANYRSIKYYSLHSSHQQLPPNTAIKIANISTIGGTGTKMAFKTEKCHVLVDEYHRWLNPPATMLTVALQSSFSKTIETTPLKTTEYTITATVFDFIANLEAKTVALGINYQIKERQGIKFSDSVTITVPLKQVDPDHYAIAMSKAVELLAQRISKAINQVQLNR
jgi:uncharacterized lipoprotein YmbA